MTKKTMIDTMIREGYITEAERLVVNKYLTNKVKEIYNNMINWIEENNRANAYIVECIYVDVYVTTHRDWIWAND